MSKQQQICTNCDALNEAGAKFCNTCGATLKQEVASTAETKKKSSKKIGKKQLGIGCLGLIFLCAICGFIGALAGGGADKEVTTETADDVALIQKNEAQEPEIVDELAEEAEQDETPEEEEEELEPTAPAFTEIKSVLAEGTEAQWNKYAEELEGNRAEGWTGWIADVNEKTFGGYEVWVDMDSNDEILSTQDVYLEISEEVALALTKGDAILFDGTIDSANDVLGSISIRMTDIVLPQLELPEATEEIPTDDSPLEFLPIREMLEKSTDSQWNKYADSLKGQPVENWSGWILEVNEKTFGGYEVWVDMDSNGELFSTQDVTFDVTEEQALSLAKDSQITFSGTIKNPGDFLGSLNINLEDVVIQE